MALYAVMLYCVVRACECAVAAVCVSASACECEGECVRACVNASGRGSVCMRV